MTRDQITRICEILTEERCETCLSRVCYSCNRHDSREESSKWMPTNRVSVLLTLLHDWEASDRDADEWRYEVDSLECENHDLREDVEPLQAKIDDMREEATARE